MALVLCQQVETKIPIEVQGLTPDKLLGKSNLEIAKQLVQHGNQQVEVGESFKVSGKLDEDETIVFDGILEPVHWIGAGQKSGLTIVESKAGRHLGSQMTGGQITCENSVSDFAGCEMTGGTIRIAGNAGDLVGGHYPGSKYGMNRGSILINGSVGKGLGQGIRRGTIVVGGDAGGLVGWNMLAGTIVVQGSCGMHPGAGMTRGTIVLGQADPSLLLPTFSKGGTYRVPVLNMLVKWLLELEFGSDSTGLVETLKGDFTEFNGDLLKGGRGELFIGHA